MKRLTLALVLIPTLCFAGTLVKYEKQTGDIIQTNNVEKIPSQEILNNRFISETTDVIFVEDSVDITKQRVDKNSKQLINIPKKELDDKEKVIKDIKDKRELDKKKAEDKLKALGFNDDELDAILN